QLAAATPVAWQPLATGSLAGEFGPQAEMSLAANLLESQAGENRWRAPGSGFQGGGSQGAAYQGGNYQGGVAGGRSVAESQGAYRDYFRPLQGAAQTLPESGDIPPLGYALAQLKGVFILAE